MIYADFISSLKTAMRKTSHPEDLKTQLPLDLAGKMKLISELGILDFLTDKYATSENGLSEIKLAEIISQMMGESPEQAQLVLHLMKKMSSVKCIDTFDRQMAAD
jgi:hypothetical protein